MAQKGFEILSVQASGDPASLLVGSVAESVHVFLCAEVKKEAEEGDEPRAETESESEEELSCFAPTVRMENEF